MPRPVDYLRTSWSRDPLALCSYSYLAPTRYGSEVRRMLAEPVGRIVFAGEATANIPATVHGALQAGRDAAKALARRLDAGARVAVVGAGVAGLACAGELLDQGLQPVLLEASDRVGGRVRSGELDGSRVELGASWIHGIKGNPLTTLARQAGIGLHHFEYALDFPVPGQQAMGERGEDRIWRSIDSFDPHAPGMREQTLESLLPRRQGPGLAWASQTEVQQEYGADPDQLAALATWEGGWFGGGDALLDGPYVDVVKGLSDQAPVHFGAQVRRIIQTSSEVVLSGSGVLDGEGMAADAAIVTVPIGVLKAGRIEFEPDLPPRTRTAIRLLGAGLLDKVWLAFEKPFWDPKWEGFNWIDPRMPGRWGSWANFVPINGRPFLMTLSGGSDAHRLAGWSDLEVVGSAMSSLEAMFAQS
ncbi:MAG: hypothetical protein BGO23_05420 [Solirubrobacterales bacterium 67-14]|nr:MAG: hypothetical protein BGO23_05420 [Solirubrobacterales bacterium 67-14]